MNLYDYPQIINQMLDRAFDSETGEILDENLMYAVEQLEMDMHQKIECLALGFKETKITIDAIDAEMKALKDRKDELEVRNKKTAELLGHFLNGQKFETPRCKISFRKTQETVILNEKAVPDKYKKFSYTFNRDDVADILDKATKEDVKISKNDIKNDINNGIQVDGAIVLNKKSMTVK